MEPTNDPLGLDINLKDVDTSYPVAIAGQHPSTIKAFEVVPKKDDPTKRNIELTLALSQDVERDGMPDKIVNAGYEFRTWYPLQQSDNPKAPDFKIGIAKLVDAVFHTNEDTRPETCPPATEFIGRPVMAVVKVENDAQYGSRNKVQNILALR